MFKINAMLPVLAALFTLSSEVLAHPSHAHHASESSAGLLTAAAVGALAVLAATYAFRQFKAQPNNHKEQ